MKRIVECHVLPDHRLDLVFDDGVRGVVDLSDLVGQGVFACWRDPDVFARVHIGSSGEIAWSEQLDLCPDALYLQATGKTPADLFPSLAADAGDGGACGRAPLPPVTPGEMLREEFLIPLRISRSRLSRETGIPLRRIAEIVRGRRPITVDDDLRINRFLGLTKGYWLRAQLHHDLESAEIRLADELAKIEPWKSADSGDDACDRVIEADAKRGALPALVNETISQSPRGGEEPKASTARAGQRSSRSTGSLSARPTQSASSDPSSPSGGRTRHSASDGRRS